jgi:hypothetical protein
MKLVSITSHNQAVKYYDGHDTGNCRSICRGKCKTLRTLPFGHRIELSFFSGLQNFMPHPRELELAKVGPWGIF